MGYEELGSNLIGFEPRFEKSLIYTVVNDEWTFGKSGERTEI